MVDPYACQPTTAIKSATLPNNRNGRGLTASAHESDLAVIAGNRGQSSYDVRDHSNGIKTRPPNHPRQVPQSSQVMQLRSPVPNSTNPLLPEIITQLPKSTV